MAVPILMLHSVDVTSAPAFARWSLTPWRLAGHLEALREEGWTPVSLPALVAAERDGTPLPPRPYAVTVDDGFRDFAVNALPVLTLFEVPVTLLVTTRYLGSTARWLGALGEDGRRMLTDEEVAELAGEGVTIGAHGDSHAMLDLLPHDAVNRDLRRSRDRLLEIVGHPLDIVAYPHGYSTAAVRAEARDLGFTTGLAVADRLHTADDDPMALSRVEVRGDMQPEDLVRHLAAAGSGPSAARAVSATAWRLVRRGTVGRGQRALEVVG